MKSEVILIRSKTQQVTLMGDLENPLHGFERPEFSEEDFSFCKSAVKKAIPDRNWLYVEYYGDDETFKKLFEALYTKGALQSKHTINPEEFKRMVELYERYAVSDS